MLVSPLIGCLKGTGLSVEDIMQNYCDAMAIIKSKQIDRSLCMTDIDTHEEYEMKYIYRNNREDFHIQKLYEVEVIEEFIYIDGNGFYKGETTQGNWSEGLPPDWSQEDIDTTIIESSQELTPEILEISDSYKLLGVERIKGSNTYHIVFHLSPEMVIEHLSTTVADPSLLAQNTGGQIELWIEVDSFYPVKYEGSYHNLMPYGESGYFDMKDKWIFSDINEPIIINKPI